MTIRESLQWVWTEHALCGGFILIPLTCSAWNRTGIRRSRRKTKYSDTTIREASSKRLLSNLNVKM
jgi:hypothetical protein